MDDLVVLYQSGGASTRFSAFARTVDPGKISKWSCHFPVIFMFCSGACRTCGCERLILDSESCSRNPLQLSCLVSALLHPRGLFSSLVLRLIQQRYVLLVSPRPFSRQTVPYHLPNLDCLRLTHDVNGPPACLLTDMWLPHGKPSNTISSNLQRVSYFLLNF